MTQRWRSRLNRHGAGVRDAILPASAAFADPRTGMTDGTPGALWNQVLG
jgi:hypothetical protein